MNAFAVKPQEIKNSILVQLNELDFSLQDLLQELENASTEQLNRTLKEGKWSALQICYHLILSERLSIGYVKRKLSFDPKLKTAGMATRMRLKLLKTYLKTSFPYPAPVIVNETNFPEQITLEQVRDEWLELRREIRKFLEECPPGLYDKELYKHAVAGRLTLEGMIVFFQEHFNRHRKQILRVSGV